MESKIDSASARVRSSFQQLAKAAANLNTVSDELGKSIDHLDDALKRLNLGVTAWVQMEGNEGESEYWWSREIGYAKIGGKWGIALRTSSGYYDDPERTSEDSWLFNDAPRWLRLLSVEHLPALIERLIATTCETTEKIKAKIAEANELASAIDSIVSASTRK